MLMRHESFLSLQRLLYSCIRGAPSYGSTVWVRGGISDGQLIPTALPEGFVPTALLVDPTALQCGHDDMGKFKVFSDCHGIDGVIRSVHTYNCTRT